MEQHPYSAPATAVAPAKAPGHILRSIRAGWIAAALTALASLILGLVAVRLGNAAVGIGTLVESLISAGLGYGIHRKSRACTVAVSCYCVLGNCLLFSTGKLDGAVIAAILTIVYIQAARGHLPIPALAAARTPIPVGAASAPARRSAVPATRVHRCAGGRTAPPHRHARRKRDGVAAMVPGDHGDGDGDGERQVSRPEYFRL